MGVAKQITALVAVCCGLLFAQPPQWRNLYPSYTGLAFGEGKFAAVSSDGLITTSGDGGASWSQYFAPQTPQGLSSAAYGGGMFVVTREPRWVLYSFDGGGSWKTEIRDNYPCRYLIFGKERFVGIGGGGRTFLYEYDRENEFGLWRLIQPQDSRSDNLLHAAYGGGVFVAVGSNIVSSGGGDVWTERYGGFTGTDAAGLVAYGDGKFVALSSQGGAVYTSDDGTVWASSPSPTLPAGLADMAFGGGKFVAVGNAGAAVTSADGISWTPSTLSPNDNFKAVEYGEGAGFMALGASGSVYTSPDGGVWAAKAVGRAMSYKEIIFGGGKYVAVGDSGASVSADGLNWSRASVSGGGSFGGLKYAAFGAGKYVAAGDSGALFVSEDGAAWENASRSNYREIMFTGAAFGNETFMVVGYMGSTACLLTSEDGQSWKDATNITSTWQSMYPVSLGYGSGKFWAGSSDGTLRSSEAGIYWSNAALPAAQPGTRYRSVSYVNNDRFLAIGAAAGGDDITIITSPGGAAWTAIPAPPNMAVRAVTFAKNSYYAAGDSGKIMASIDGQEWFTQRLATNKNLQTIYTADGNTILAGGADGALLYSNENPILVSVRYAQSRRGALARSFRMNMERTGRTPVISLSFTPKTPGTIAVYSLAGRQLFRKNVNAGERRVPLSGRAASLSSGSVIVKYTGDGRTVVQRFQAAK